MTRCIPRQAAVFHSPVRFDAGMADCRAVLPPHSHAGEIAGELGVSELMVANDLARHRRARGRAGRLADPVLSRDASEGGSLVLPFKKPQTRNAHGPHGKVQADQRTGPVGKPALTGAF